MNASSVPYPERFDDSATQRWENEGGGLPVPRWLVERKPTVEPSPLTSFWPDSAPGTAMKGLRHVDPEARSGPSAQRTWRG